MKTTKPHLFVAENIPKYNSVGGPPSYHSPDKPLNYSVETETANHTLNAENETYSIPSYTFPSPNMNPEAPIFTTKKSTYEFPSNNINYNAVSEFRSPNETMKKLTSSEVSNNNYQAPVNTQALAPEVGHFNMASESTQRRNSGRLSN